MARRPSKTRTTIVFLLMSACVSEVTSKYFAPSMFPQRLLSRTRKSPFIESVKHGTDSLRTLVRFAGDRAHSFGRPVQGPDDPGPESAASKCREGRGPSRRSAPGGAIVGESVSVASQGEANCGLVSRPRCKWWHSAIIFVCWHLIVHEKFADGNNRQVWLPLASMPKHPITSGIKRPTICMGPLGATYFLTLACLS